MHLVNNHRMATKWRKQKGRERRFFISFCCDFDNTKVAFPAAAGQSTESRVFFSRKKGILLFLEKKCRKMARNGGRFVVITSLGHWVIGSLGHWVIGSLGHYVIGSLGHYGFENLESLSNIHLGHLHATTPSSDE